MRFPQSTCSGLLFFCLFLFSYFHAFEKKPQDRAVFIASYYFRLFNHIPLHFYFGQKHLLEVLKYTNTG